MTLNIPQKTRNVVALCRKVAATLGILGLLSHSTFGGPIRINQVVQSIDGVRGRVDLELRSVSQQSPIDTRTKGSSTGKSDNGVGVEVKTDSLLSITKTDTPNIGVDAAEDAIIEGTVCDCGENLVPVAGFPKWPLLFLAGIPLAFLGGGGDHHEDCVECNTRCITCDNIITPTPTPTPKSVPEPASLFLFGSGLLVFAGAFRRRYTKSKSKVTWQEDNTQ